MGGEIGGDPGGVVGGVPTTEPPPPPPPPTVPEGPVRVGGQVKPPRKLQDAAPVYPPLARASKMAGTVIVEAVIGKDGHVDQAKVLRGQPLLDDAALDAVRKWVYTPTLLNGEPVAVIMTVTVTFRLS